MNTRHCFILRESVRKRKPPTCVVQLTNDVGWLLVLRHADSHVDISKPTLAWSAILYCRVISPIGEGRKVEGRVVQGTLLWRGSNGLQLTTGLATVAFRLFSFWKSDLSTLRQNLLLTNCTLQFLGAVFWMQKWAVPAEITTGPMDRGKMQCKQIMDTPKNVDFSDGWQHLAARSFLMPFFDRHNAWTQHIFGWVCACNCN